MSLDGVVRGRAKMGVVVICRYLRRVAALAAGLGFGSKEHRAAAAREREVVSSGLAEAMVFGRRGGLFVVEKWNLF
jgi:hypothetical protein